MDDTMLALLHIKHARDHLRNAEQQIKEDRLAMAWQNLVDARSDCFYAAKHTAVIRDAKR